MDTLVLIVILVLVVWLATYHVFIYLRTKSRRLLYGTTDGLTGISNRIYGERAINRSISAAGALNKLFILLDIDHFKRVNDVLGHLVGDKLLMDVSEILKDEFSQNSIVCRIGGDEFVVLTDGNSSEFLVREKLEHFLRRLRLTVADKNITIDTSVSIGVVDAPLHGKDFKELYSKADKALYRSKALGRDCISYYSEAMLKLMDEDSLQNLSFSDFQNIFDSLLVTGVYVVAEDDHRILFYNRRVKEVTPRVKLGMACHELWHGTCNNCPLKIIGEKAMARSINYNDPFGDVVEISATRLMWQGRVPAFLIRVWPHVEIENPMEKSKNIFEQSMGMYTVDMNYSIVAYNQIAKDLYPRLKAGEKCYQCILGHDEPCSRCPAVREGDRSVHSIQLDESQLIVGYANVLIKNDVPACSIFLRADDKKSVSSKKGPSEVVTHNYNESHIDMVTGGCNRTGFIYTVEQLRNNGVKLSDYSILFVNIKNFKAINELFGYDGGDNLLRTVFMSIFTSFLQPHVGARKESDHFIFLVSQKNLLLEKLQGLLDFKWKYGNQEILIHCRSGIYNIDDENAVISCMIDRAKLAKEYIVDDYVKPYAIFNSSMSVNYVEQVEVLATYEAGIRNKEFEVYFQPVIDARTKKVVSAEALVRWNNPRNGLVSPGVFLPVLEQYGYISKLDLYVARAVDDYLHSRRDKNLPIIPISVNLSWMDFYDAYMMDEILDTIKSSTLPKGSIRYEITETSYASLEGNRSAVINEMRQNGAEILLDDFGSGYSSFGMIQNYDFDVLKIDMSFVRQLEKNPKVRSIVETIITMCHNLKLKVVAEGVERQCEYDFLKEKGCDYIQGYYFSKPLDRQKFDEFLKDHL